VTGPAPSGEVTQESRLVLGLLFASGLSGFLYYEFRNRVPSTWLVPVDLVFFAWTALQLVLANLHRDDRTSDARRVALSHLRLLVAIPAWKIDEPTFHRCLSTILRQTRLPQRIHVVSDCSPLTPHPDTGQPHDEVARIVGVWRPIAAMSGVELTYTRLQRNGGVRRAQATAFRADPDADIWCTLDPDTILDPSCFEKGMIPFGRRRVTAVSALLLSLNYNKNLLTRLVDVGFVMAYTVGRTSQSMLRSVQVCSGALSFYRAAALRPHLDHFVRQELRGRHLRNGNDMMLTTYALMEGGAVDQESSVGFTDQPETMRALTTQRLRWWRDWSWGIVWQIRHLPTGRLAWWLAVEQLFEFCLWTAAWPLALIVYPVSGGFFPWPVAVYLTLMAYVRATRYLAVRRADQSRRDQLLSFALSPLACGLTLYVGMLLQYWAICTPLQGNRHDPYVAAGAGAAVPVPPHPGQRRTTPARRRAAHAPRGRRPLSARSPTTAR
jgi:hyaluronan synthase